jgi:hypothetical protein
MRAIETRLLVSHERQHGSVKHWLASTDVDAFLAEHTTIGLLARRHQKSAPSLAAALRRHGVMPVGVPGWRSQGAKLFAWSDLHAAGLSTVLDAAKNEPRSIKRKRANCATCQLM